MLAIARYGCALRLDRTPFERAARSRPKNSQALSQYTIEGHASYVQSWLKVLKSDKTAIFTAAKHASAAHALIVSHADHEGEEAGA